MKPSPIGTLVPRCLFGSTGKTPLSTNRLAMAYRLAMACLLAGAACSFTGCKQAGRPSWLPFGSVAATPQDEAICEGGSCAPPAAHDQDGPAIDPADMFAGLNGRADAEGNSGQQVRQAAAVKPAAETARRQTISGPDSLFAPYR